MNSYIRTPTTFSVRPGRARASPAATAADDVSHVDGECPRCAGSTTTLPSAPANDADRLFAKTVRHQGRPIVKDGSNKGRSPIGIQYRVRAAKLKNLWGLYGCL